MQLKPIEVTSEQVREVEGDLFTSIAWKLEKIGIPKIEVHRLTFYAVDAILNSIFHDGRIVVVDSPPEEPEQNDTELDYVGEIDSGILSQ